MNLVFILAKIYLIYIILEKIKINLNQKLKNFAQILVICLLFIF